MKGCARTCLLWLVGWGAAAYAFFRYFRSLGRLDLSPLIWASIAAGLGVAFCLGSAQVIFTTARERGLLLGAATGTPLVDGKWTAVSGPIHAMRAVRAPLSGTSAVAYEYKISRVEGSGKSRGPRTYYEGKALVPSTIATRQGSVRLLSVPVFDIERAALTKDTAARHAASYIAATQFETGATPKAQRAGTVEKESTDDDGNFRVDRQATDRHVPAEELETFDFEERHIAQSETVCAFGVYSSQRGGLVPNPNWAYQTRIMRGDAATVARQLRTRMIRYAIGIAVFAAATYGIVRLVQANVTAY